MLVVAPATELARRDADEAIEILAWSAAQSDRPRRPREQLRERSPQNPRSTSKRRDEKNDELLKLSEELFAQDIELLRSNEKLGKIEKLKNDFIEKMSRELRTPLNSIIEATITVLSSENENALGRRHSRRLRNALDEGTAFQRTLQNILDLWRIKQDELPDRDPGALGRGRDRRDDLQRAGHARRASPSRSRRRSPSRSRRSGQISPRSTRSSSCCSTTQRSSPSRERSRSARGSRTTGSTAGSRTPGSGSAPTTSNTSGTSSTRSMTAPAHATAVPVSD